MLKCVHEVDAHRSAYGEKDKAFEKVLSSVVLIVPPQVWTRQEKSTFKTLQDKFRTMMSTIRSVNAEDEKASGIAEIVTDTDQLMVDFLMEEKDYVEERCRTREETTEREARLIVVGREIHSKALEQPWESNSSTSRKKNKCAYDDKFYEWCLSMNEELYEQSSHPQM